jgi:signal transduction histidine kinase/integral membrane sensor domain MASE1
LSQHQSSGNLRQMKRRVSTALKVLALAVTYLAAGYAGLKLARVNPSVSAVWPPTGIGIAALLLWGRKLWPGIFIGAFCVNFITQGSLLATFGVATGNTLEVFVGAWLVLRYAGGVATFERAQSILKFVFLAGILSTAISATFGVTSLCMTRLADWNRYGSIWLTWWTGDLVGALKFAPLVIIWSRPLPRLTWKRGLEGICLLCTVTVVAVLIFTRGNHPLGYMMVPPLLWATLRFGQHGAISCAFIMSAIAVWGTVHNLGPYATGNLNDSLLFVQAYIGIVTMSALVLAAVVSENKHTMHELQIQEQQAQERIGELETFMEAAPAIIWIAHDAECKVITGNQLGEEILRAPPGKNLSRSGGVSLSHVQMFKGGRLLPPSEMPMQIAGRDRKPLWKYEMELRFSDETSQWLYGNVVPLLKPDGSVRGVLGVFVDITERKQAEEALAKSEEELQRLNRELDERVRSRTAQLQTTLEDLETFSYSVSHDMRAPLRSIQSFSEIVLMDHGKKLDPPGIELLKKVMRAAERLDHLIQDVLAFSRVSRQEIKIENVDVERLIRQIIQERPELQAPNAEIEIRSPLAPVRGHDASLTQCITNLLDNAVKFVARGTKPRVVVGSDRIDNDVRLWFQDNGIGIERAAQARMFGMFQRFHRDDAYPGTGIGLAIVRKAAERMNGKVGVESEPGKGSRFWLELKAAN